MEPSNVNLIPVIVAGVINMIIGAGWYGVFAKPWMALNNLTEETRQAKSSQMGPIYSVTMLTSLIMAYILAYFINHTQAYTIPAGLQIGVFAWLGFVVTTFVPTYLFSFRPIKLLLIDACYYGVSFSIMGILFALWH